MTGTELAYYPNKNKNVVEKKIQDLEKIKLDILILILLLSFFTYTNLNSANYLEGNFTDIKVLDKISSKNTLIKLKNWKRN